MFMPNKTAHNADDNQSHLTTVQNEKIALQKLAIPDYYLLEGKYNVNSYSHTFRDTKSMTFAQRCNRKKHILTQGNFFTEMNQEKRDIQYFCLPKPILSLEGKGVPLILIWLGRKVQKAVFLCENISIFPGKEHAQWKNCKANIHSEGFYH